MIKSKQYTGMLRFMSLKQKNGEYFLDGIISEKEHMYHKKSIPCKEITEFNQEQVTEVIVSRPLSYPIRDKVESRLVIELDTFGKIIRMEMG